MSLMISVSGIRGVVGKSLTPENLTAFTMAFATWIRRRKQSLNPGLQSKPKIVIGRDSRPTGGVITGLVSNALSLSGCDVVDVGMTTTPTVEIATAGEGADGGLIVTASHNPVEWNALKMLNEKGEFLTALDVEELLDIADKKTFDFARWDGIGSLTANGSWDAVHIGRILKLSCLDLNLIASMNFRVLIDAVEGAGSYIVPELCRKLGISEIKTLACEGTGIFPRNPEPVEHNLRRTMEIVARESCEFGIIVDPDVDRLALVCQDGTLFGEEYTLVACADFYLKHHKGPVVNNLSSSRALRDIARKHQVECFSAKVGEANVTEVMKEQNAVIGGEGNGGVILPELHYGRDALAGIALFLQAFAEWKSETGGTLSGFRKTFPDYFMSKKKVELAALTKEALGKIFDTVAANHPEAECNRLDGLKLDFENGWAHLRPSNTEPIVRIYTEASTQEEADALAASFIEEIEAAAKSATATRS
ncbi:phosphoglucosamine mutase [Chlorobaculum sp. 24CR]|uniref:phosphoglucosamine mutase n=1 Tax=Chlorobaculum sp. 24CR TaxID=2508878 RepID=UPI00100B2D77|nr:phosphoglucosamine mutase [Chlorobaculum sp. 24CR]RXK88686.1 phosphoglucosamine mutase [Chlorobaculum sp. 24CR]